MRNHTRVPAIETEASIVHTYFDDTADLTKVQAIIAIAKTRRVSMCNALDCLLVHRPRLSDLLTLIAP